MSFKPLESQYTTGRNIHVVRHHPDGRVWNQTAQAWEVYDSGNWINYAYALTEQAGSCYYRAANNIPDLDILTTDALYERISSVPTLPSTAGGDIPIGMGQTQGSDIFSIGGSVASADNLEASTGVVIPAAVASGTPTTTSLISNLTNTLDNAYVGRVIVFTSGDLIGCGARITGYNGTSKTLTFTAVPTAPAIADEFIIV